MSRSIAFECFGSKVTLQISPEMRDEVNEVTSKLQWSSDALATALYPRLLRGV
jgi:hypothetical protein